MGRDRGEPGRAPPSVSHASSLLRASILSAAPSRAGASMSAPAISCAAASAPVSGGITSTSRRPSAEKRVTLCGSCSSVDQPTGTVRPATDTQRGMTGQWTGFRVTPVMRPQRSPNAAVKGGSSRVSTRERGHHMPSSPPGPGVMDSRTGGAGLLEVVRSMVTGMPRTHPRAHGCDPVLSITGNGTRSGAGARKAPGAFTVLRPPAQEIVDDLVFPCLRDLVPGARGAPGQSQSLRLNVR